MAAHPDTRRFRSFISPGGLFSGASKVETFYSVRNEHDYGNFQRSAWFVEEMLADDRVQAVTDTRVSALLAADLTFRPASDRRKAVKIAEELGGQEDAAGVWRDMCSSAAQADMLSWGIHLGFAVAEIVWDRSETRWMPRLKPWHPQWVRWDWTLRRFVLQTQEGQVVLPDPSEQPRSDGKWVVWCPRGVEYGWRKGLMRSLGLRYIARGWDFRDWARYCEKHGLAILLAKTPQGAQEDDERDYLTAVANLGGDSSLLARQGASEQESYGLELLEPTAQTWQTFKEFKIAIDTDIAVAMLGQNLTTDNTQGGSQALGKVQNLVRLDKAHLDAEIASCLTRQVFSWYVEYNYGDARLTPVAQYQVAPPEDQVAATQAEKNEADAIVSIGEGIRALQDVGVNVDARAIVEGHGIPVLDGEPEPAEDDDELDGEDDPADAGGDSAAPSAPASAPKLTPSATGAVMFVNEARAIQGLPSIGPDGDVTINEYEARQKAKIASELGSQALPSTLRAALRAGRPARKRNVAAIARAARYTNGLESSAKRAGASAMRGTLEEILAAVNQGGSFEDIKKRVLSRFKGLNADEIAGVVRKTRIMANLAGRGAVLEEI